jgi:hypothetical protein
MTSSAKLPLLAGRRNVRHLWRNPLQAELAVHTSLVQLIHVK